LHRHRLHRRCLPSYQFFDAVLADDAIVFAAAAGPFPPTSARGESSSPPHARQNLQRLRWPRIIHIRHRRRICRRRQSRWVGVGRRSMHHAGFIPCFSLPSLDSPPRRFCFSLPVGPFIDYIHRIRLAGRFLRSVALSLHESLMFTTLLLLSYPAMVQGPMTCMYVAYSYETTIRPRFGT